MNTYLYFETGECNDSLRDRDFYIVEAPSVKVADTLLQAYIAIEGENTMPCSIVEQYGVFLTFKDTTADQIHIPELDYSIQSIEVVNKNLSTDFIQSVCMIWDIWEYDARTLDITLKAGRIGDNTHEYYFGNEWFGIEFKAVDDHIVYTIVGG